MQKFKLVRQFREWNVGDIFKKNDDGTWSYGDEFINQRSHRLDTLLDISMDGVVYLEEINKFTPNVGQNFLYITGAGEIKAKEWTNSAWCQACRDTFGVFPDTPQGKIDATTKLTRLLSIED
jgi:hypothetical protein